MRDSWWWAWIVSTLFIVALVVKFTTRSAGFPAHTPPSRYAIPSLLVLGGSGMYMIADGPLARVAVSLLLCFSMVIALRALIRGRFLQTEDYLSHAAPVLFSSSIALFSATASATLLVTLLDFSSWGAVAIVFLSCLATIRQALEWMGKSQKHLASWYWALSLVCTEVFSLVLLLPLPIVSGAALVWIVYGGLIEFFRVRVQANGARTHTFVLSAVYSAACIILLFTARWP